MPRRKGPVDQNLRDKMIAAAESIVASDGPAALTARRLASAIGYSQGHIYNLFPDLNSLVLAINARTLERLYQALDAAPGPDRLQTLAGAYLAFTTANANLWQLALSHRLTPGETLPESYAARIAALPDLVRAELKALFPARAEDELRQDVALLWAALHGLSNLGLSGRLALISAPTPDALARRLIDGYLSAQTARPA